MILIFDHNLRPDYCVSDRFLTNFMDNLHAFSFQLIRKALNTQNFSQLSLIAFLVNHFLTVHQNYCQNGNFAYLLSFYAQDYF